MYFQYKVTILHFKQENPISSYFFLFPLSFLSFMQFTWHNHIVLSCDKCFTYLSLLDQSSNSNNIKLRTRGKWYIVFCFFSRSFIFVQHSLLFDSNNMIHWIISFAIYFISNYLIMVIRLQLYQPSNIMVWDLSFLLLLFFSFVISDSIQTASLIDSFGVQFFYCQVISFSLLLSNPNKIKHRATWWVYLIFRFLSLLFLF